MGSGIIFNNGGGGSGQNPTANYIPLNNGTSNFVDSFIFNDVSNSILSTRNGVGGDEFGLYINFPTGITQIGDIGNVNTKSIIEVDSGNGIIKTSYSANDNGLKLDFINNEFYFGNFNNNSGAVLKVLDSISTIRTDWQNHTLGFSLDFINFVYIFGDINNDFNGTKIVIDDANQNIDFNLGNKLQFFGGSLVAASASGASGDHLIIYINGNQYKIQLLNP